MDTLEGYEEYIFEEQYTFNYEKSIFITWRLIGFTRMLIRKFIQFHHNDKYYNRLLREFESESYGLKILLIFLNFI